MYKRQITGSGNLTLADTVPGFFVFGGLNTYTGTTAINSGITLSLGVSNALPTATALTLNGTATFDLDGFNQTLGSLTSGAGPVVQNSGGASTLTLNTCLLYTSRCV